LGALEQQPFTKFNYFKLLWLNLSSGSALFYFMYSEVLFVDA
jgi:hypothetical protein